MKPAFALLSFLLILAVVMCLGTALFIGFGALLAHWLPLSLFQASGLAIGTTIAIAALVYVLSTIKQSQDAYASDDELDDDDEEDFDPAVADLAESVLKPDFSRIPRNNYCPCGSGRKFKNCCEKTTIQ